MRVADEKADDKKNSLANIKLLAVLDRRISLNDIRMVSYYLFEASEEDLVDDISVE